MAILVEVMLLMSLGASMMGSSSGDGHRGFGSSCSAIPS